MVIILEFNQEKKKETAASILLCLWQKRCAQ